MEVWQCGSVEVWKCGIVWQCGSMEVSQYGSVEVWQSGNVAGFGIKGLETRTNFTVSLLFSIVI